MFCKIKIIATFNPSVVKAIYLSSVPPSAIKDTDYIII